MEIRIAYHPTSDISINRISEILKENGIIAELKTTASASKNDVRVTFTKAAQSHQMATTLLDSSFVHTEQEPGY